MAAESFVGAKRQLESRALKMTDQNMNVVGIDQSHFRRLAQEIFRMIHDELIQRRARRDQHRHRHSAAPAGAAHALPRGRNRSGIAGKHGNIQASDIDAQLQRIRGNHAANRAVPQAALDLPPFIRQISAAISDNRQFVGPAGPCSTDLSDIAPGFP